MRDPDDNAARCRIWARQMRENPKKLAAFNRRRKKYMRAYRARKKKEAQDAE